MKQAIASVNSYERIQFDDSGVEWVRFRRRGRCDANSSPSEDRIHACVRFVRCDKKLRIKIRIRRTVAGRYFAAGRRLQILDAA
jgi:hypothetical protein